MFVSGSQKEVVHSYFRFLAVDAHDDNQQKQRLVQKKAGANLVSHLKKKGGIY